VTFTVSSLQPVGRPKIIGGRPTHTRYASKHAIVTYDIRKPDELWVTVELLASGESRRWRSVVAYPSVECARLAAESAHRIAVRGLGVPAHA
jgi:hypothetical protein